MNNWDEIYGDLKRRGLIIFLFLVSAGYLFMGRAFALGIILGWIIIILNFSFLQSTIIKAFKDYPAVRRKRGLLMAKSFLRLSLLGGIVFVLIKYEVADPVGLATGLSIIFFSIVSMGISGARKAGNWRVF